MGSASFYLPLPPADSLQFLGVDKEVICLPLVTLSSVPSSELERLYFTQLSVCVLQNVLEFF